MDDSLMGNSTSSFFPSGQNPNALRRAPVMGNRGLETQQRISQERSRSKPKSYSKDRGSGGGSPRSGRRERRGGSASGSTGSGASSSLIQVIFTANFIFKILNLYISLSLTHLPLLSSIYSFLAMHSLLVTIML